MIQFTIKTLGCKVNQTEAEQMVKRLSSAGMRFAVDLEQQDVIIINTCAVTHIAERKSRQFVRKAMKLNPTARLYVTGCATRTDLDRLKAILGVDFIYHDKKLLVDKIIKDHQDQLTPDYSRHHFFPESDGLHTRAYLMVQDGCENYCAYCIIPYVRGNNKSLELDEIQKELIELKPRKLKEIVLTGINLGMYAASGKNIMDVCSLVFQEIPDCRIRFGSIEPNLIPDTLLDSIVSNPRFCRHLHIPLQGGSDRLLVKMNRKYLTADYTGLLTRIRAEVPDIAITTDLIVGFPGEEEADVRDTLAFLEQCQFAKIHIFPYSRRIGTPAAQMSQLDAQLVSQRFDRIASLEKNLRMNYLNRFVGAELAVLIEEKTSHIFTGLSSNYLKVKVTGTDCQVNEIYTVKISHVDQDVLVAFPL